MNRVKREMSKSDFIENDQAREACKPHIKTRGIKGIKAWGAMAR